MRFIILSVEGVLVEGHAEPRLAEALENIQLDLTIMQRPVWTGTMGRVTVHDAVLDARIRQMENMLSELLHLEEFSDDHPAQRLRRGLQRLGWKPYKGIDNRRLAPPQYVPRRANVDVEVTVAPNLPIQKRLRLRVLLRGIATIDML